jgi:hypothetical protein
VNNSIFIENKTLRFNENELEEVKEAKKNAEEYLQPLAFSDRLENSMVDKIIDSLCTVTKHVEAELDIDIKNKLTKQESFMFNSIKEHWYKFRADNTALSMYLFSIASKVIDDLLYEENEGQGEGQEGEAEEEKERQKQRSKEFNNTIKSRKGKSSYSEDTENDPFRFADEVSDEGNTDYIQQMLEEIAEKVNSIKELFNSALFGKTGEKIGIKKLNVNNVSKVRPIDLIQPNFNLDLVSGRLRYIGKKPTKQLTMILFLDYSGSMCRILKLITIKVFLKSLKNYIIENKYDNKFKIYIIPYLYHLYNGTLISSIKELDEYNENYDCHSGGDTNIGEALVKFSTNYKNNSLLIDNKKTGQKEIGPIKNITILCDGEDKFNVTEATSLALIKGWRINTVTIGTSNNYLKKISDKTKGKHIEILE